MTDTNIKIKPGEITLFIPDGKSKVMHHQSKLSNELLQEVYRQRHEGMSLAQIKAWLLDEYKISITISSLCRRLKKVAQLNQVVAQAIYIQSAVQGAEDMTKLIDKSITQLDGTYDLLVGQGMLPESRAHKETLLKYIALKVKLVELGSQTNKEDNQDTVEVEELLSRMSNHMLSEATEEEPSEETDE